MFTECSSGSCYLDCWERHTKRSPSRALHTYCCNTYHWHKASVERVTPKSLVWFPFTLAHSRSLPHALMPEYLWENDKSPVSKMMFSWRGEGLLPLAIFRRDFPLTCQLRCISLVSKAITTATLNSEPLNPEFWTSELWTLCFHLLEFSNLGRLWLVSLESNSLKSSQWRYN